MYYYEYKVITRNDDIIKKLIEINALEELLFSVMEEEKISNDDYRRNYLNKILNDMQIQYSIIHI